MIRLIHFAPLIALALMNGACAGPAAAPTQSATVHLAGKTQAQISEEILRAAERLCAAEYADAAAMRSTCVSLSAKRAMDEATMKFAAAPPPPRPERMVIASALR